MRAAQRNNDNTLRWALVGGIVVVVVIATIIAVSGAFGSKTASPPATPGGTSGCLFPATVHSSTAVLTAPALALNVPPKKAKKRLVAVERIFARHHSLFLAVSRNGHHFIASRGGGLVLGTVGGKVKALQVKPEDIAFSANGKHLIYQVSPTGTKYSCASVVLMTMALNGKHPRLLIASKYSLLNEGAAATMGTLMEDVLPNGWLALADATGKLSAFNPTRKLVGPLQTGTLGTAYTGSGTSAQPSVQVSVSPNGKYFAETSQTTGGFSVLALPGDRIVRTVAVGTLPVWSHSGNRLAFITHKASAAGLAKEVIGTIDLSTAKSHTVKTNAKKFGLLTLDSTSIVWSADDKWVGFTGAPTACAGAKTCRVRAFIGKWTGKHVHMVAASKVHHKPKKPATTHY